MQRHYPDRTKLLKQQVDDKKDEDRDEEKQKKKQEEKEKQKETETEKAMEKEMKKVEMEKQMEKEKEMMKEMEKGMEKEMEKQKENLYLLACPTLLMSFQSEVKFFYSDVRAEFVRRGKEHAQAVIFLHQYTRMLTQMSTHGFDSAPGYYRAALSDFFKQLQEAWGITTQTIIGVMEEALEEVKFTRRDDDLGGSLVAFCSTYAAQFELLMQERRESKNSFFELGDECGSNTERKHFVNSLKYKRGLPPFIVSKIDDFFGDRNEEISQQSLAKVLSRVRVCGHTEQQRARTGGSALRAMGHHDHEFEEFASSPTPALVNLHEQQHQQQQQRQLQELQERRDSMKRMLEQHNNFSTTTPGTPSAAAPAAGKCGGKHREFHHIAFNRKITGAEKKTGKKAEVKLCSFCGRHHAAHPTGEELICPDKIASEDQRQGDLKCNMACAPYEYDPARTQWQKQQAQSTKKKAATATTAAANDASAAAPDPSTVVGVLKKNASWATSLESNGFSQIRTMHSTSAVQWAYLDLSQVEFDGIVTTKSIPVFHAWEFRPRSTHHPFGLKVHVPFAALKGHAFSFLQGETRGYFATPLPLSAVAEIHDWPTNTHMRNDEAVGKGSFSSTKDASFRPRPQCFVHVGERKVRALLDSACEVGVPAEGQNLVAEEFFNEVKKNNPDRIRNERECGSDIVQLGADTHLVPYRRRLAEFKFTLKDVKTGSVQELWLPLAIVNWLCREDEVVFGLDTYDRVLGVLLDDRVVQFTRLKISVPRYDDAGGETNEETVRVLVHLDADRLQKGKLYALMANNDCELDVTPAPILLSSETVHVPVVLNISHESKISRQFKRDMLVVREVDGDRSLSKQELPGVVLGLEQVKRNRNPILVEQSGSRYQVCYWNFTGPAETVDERGREKQRGARSSFKNAKYKKEERRQRDPAEELREVQREIAEKKSKWPAGGGKISRSSAEWRRRVLEKQDELLSELPPGLKERVKKLIDAECMHDDGAAFPVLRGITARHRVKAGAKWKVQQPFPFGLLDSERISFLLEEHVFEGKIRKVDSSKEALPGHSSPVFLADRKGHQVRRIVVDYREYNTNVEEFAFVMPRMEKIFQNLLAGRPKWFVIVDLAMGYNQMPLEDETARYLSWATPQGIFIPTRLPLGPKWAPAAFQSHTARVFGSVPWMNVFIDDICFAADSDEQLVERLEVLFAKCRESGFCLSLRKSIFGARSVEVLGFEFSERGRTIAAKKRRVLQEWPAPRSSANLKSLICFANYLREYIPSFTELVQPLKPYAEKRKRFALLSEDAEALDALDRLRNSVSSEVYFTTIDPAKAFDWRSSGCPVEVYVDASELSCGFVICQRQQANGLPLPIFRKAHSWSETELHWSTMEKEIFAMLYFLREGWDEVSQYQILLYFDHKNAGASEMMSLWQNTRVSKKVRRWIDEMFDVFCSGKIIRIFLTGRQNVLADAVSRTLWKGEAESLHEAPLQEGALPLRCAELLDFLFHRSEEVSRRGYGRSTTDDRATAVAERSPVMASTMMRMLFEDPERLHGMHAQRQLAFVPLSSQFSVRKAALKPTDVELVCEYTGAVRPSWTVRMKTKLQTLSWEKHNRVNCPRYRPVELDADILAQIFDPMADEIVLEAAPAASNGGQKQKIAEYIRAQLADEHDAAAAVDPNELYCELWRDALYTGAAVHLSWTKATDNDQTLITWPEAWGTVRVVLAYANKNSYRLAYGRPTELFEDAAGTSLTVPHDGKRNETKRHNKYLFTVVDAATGYGWIFLCRTTNLKEVIGHLDKVFKDQGYPSQIRCDNGFGTKKGLLGVFLREE
eukprot:g19230.t1